MVDNHLRQQILDLIRQKSPPRLAADVEQSVKESLVLTTTAQPDDQLAIGTSKLGGKPDLPSDVKWPDWKGKPLAFIAQINLTDLPPHDFLSILPESGILSFFYSAEQETWGFDPNDKGGWRVLHFDQRAINRRSLPTDLPEVGIYKACSFDFEVSITLPDLESPYIDLDYDREQWDEIDQYIDLMKSFKQLVGTAPCIHRLLGHLDQIQSDMLLEAQLASHGLYCGDSSGYQDPRRKELESGAVDWHLLLQIDSDSDGGMMWGDVGRLYYLMTSEGMKNRNFETAWMILQCT